MRVEAKQMNLKKIGIVLATTLTLSLQNVGAEEASVSQNGWQESNGTEYYYENGVVVKSRWIDKFYVDETGKKVVNQLIFDSNYQSFFFLQADGTYANNQWVEINQQWYYFKSGGYMAKNQWQGDYYLKDNGIMAQSELVHLPDPFYLKADGRYAQEEWIQVNGQWYYFKKLGYAAKNEWVGQYYLEDNGQMAVNKWIYDNKSQSYFYLKADGSRLNNGWQKIDGKWYFFKNDGTMLAKGWQGQYYLKANGHMAENEWIYDDNYQSYFYLKADGSYANNEWQKIDGKWYQFKPGGEMIYSQWSGNYYLKGSGAMAENEWFYDSNYKSYFYLKADGSYANNEWLKIDNKWYSFKHGGYMRQNEWFGKFYLDASGAMLTGTQIMGNTRYDFSDNGELISSELAKGWIKTADGNRYFYNNKGERIGDENVKKVIDVSEHNGKINWETVIRENEIDGVIVRLGFSVSSTDKMLEYNIKELNRLKIPYGVYLYSYAENEDDGKFEAQHTMNLMKRYDVNPTYPIYYDVENWEYANKTKRAPQDQATWVKIINKYMQTMHDAGYNNVRVYSYRYLLQTRLNHPDILKYVDWVAAYQDSLGYENPYYSGPKGWQYSSSGQLKGHNGQFDMNVWY